MSKEWISGNTLGGKHKAFNWNYSKENGITIKRILQGEGEYITVFCAADIEKIIDYVSKRGKVELGSNVEKLDDGTEKEGLGKFAKIKLGKITKDAQATSQLASIFVCTNIFDYNGTLVNMEFWIKDMDWREKLKRFVEN